MKTIKKIFSDNIDKYLIYRSRIGLVNDQAQNLGLV